MGANQGRKRVQGSTDGCVGGEVCKNGLGRVRSDGKDEQLSKEAFGISGLI